MKTIYPTFAVSALGSDRSREAEHRGRVTETAPLRCGPLVDWMVTFAAASLIRLRTLRRRREDSTGMSGPPSSNGGTHIAPQSHSP